MTVAVSQVEGERWKKYMSNSKNQSDRKKGEVTTRFDQLYYWLLYKAIKDRRSRIFTIRSLRLPFTSQAAFHQLYFMLKLGLVTVHSQTKRFTIYEKRF